jgi:hypothetical protein
MTLVPAGRRSAINAAIIFGGLLCQFCSADDAAEPRGEQTTVRLHFVGADDNQPIAGLHVLVTQGHGSQQKTFGPFAANETGTAEATLPLGFFSLQLQADKEIPYLPVEAAWNKRSRTTRPDLSLAVRKSGVEKWSDGKRREEGTEMPSQPGKSPRITYKLLRACELKLRAIDAETGDGLQGVEFYTENALAEDWGHDIDNDTIALKRDKGSPPPPPATNATDEKGNFRRLVSANAGYKYGVAKPPAGYVQTEPVGEVEVDVRYGQKSAEHVFKFRRGK